MSQRYDDQYFARHERDRERERGRNGEHEHRSQSSDSSNEYSEQYGQREPYGAPSPGGYGASGHEPRSEYSRDAGRGGSWNERPGQSRYSESQYGQRRFARDPYDPQPEVRGAGVGGYNGDRGYGGGRGYAPPADDWRRSRAFGVGYSGTGDNYSGYGSPASFEPPQRYDTQAPGGVGYSGERGRFGEEVFGAPTEPSYFGTGSYGDGGARFGGGYGEERSRWASSSYGQYQGPERTGGSSYTPGGAYGGPHGSSHGSSHGGEHRPGLLSRLFHRGPKGYQRSDERLKEDISERLMQAGHIDSSDVSITVVSGAVTLEGTVPDRYMKHNIEDLVDACPGVQDIDNRVRVSRNYGGGATTTAAASQSAAAANVVTSSSLSSNGKRKDS